MARRVTRLEVITPAAGASVLTKGTPRGQPLFRGDDPKSDENLVCGSCGGLLGRGISLEVLRGKFSAPTQLAILCDCGAHNLIAHGIAN
jgi:hypothetical protein